jgi:hypothetical protein
LYKKLKVMFVIVKNVKKKNGKVLPVILLNSQSEIWEFNSFDDAMDIKDAFENNSDSGHIYSVKKI